MTEEDALNELTEIYRETDSMDMFSERNSRKLLLMINDAVVAASFINTSNGSIIHRNMASVKLYKVPHYMKTRRKDEANAYHELFAQVREALLYLNSGAEK